MKNGTFSCGKKYRFNYNISLGFTNEQVFMQGWKMQRAKETFFVFDLY